MTLIPIFRADRFNPAIGTVISEAGEIQIVFQEYDLTVDVVGRCDPLRAIVSIRRIDGGSWSGEVTVEMTGKAHGGSVGSLARLTEDLAEEDRRARLIWESVQPTRAVDRAERLAAMHSLSPPAAKPKRDASLSEGVAYIASGRWNETVNAVLGDSLEKFDILIEEIVQRARDGEITVWGRPAPHSIWDTQKSPHEVVPPKHWRDYLLDETSLVDEEERPKTQGRNGTWSGAYSDLMISKHQFERAWPQD